MALQQIGKVLKAPFDASDGVLTRNKVTAAGIAVNAQLRADEQQLRPKTTGDVFERLLKLMEEQKKLLPKTSVATRGIGTQRCRSYRDWFTWRRF